MRSRNASRKAVPRLLALLAILTMFQLGLGDQADNLKNLPTSWLRVIWSQEARAATPRRAGVLKVNFRYSAKSAPYTITVEGIKLRCVQYVGPGHVYAECVIPSGPKA